MTRKRPAVGEPEGHRNLLGYGCELPEIEIAAVQVDEENQVRLRAGQAQQVSGKRIPEVLQSEVAVEPAQQILAPLEGRPCIPATVDVGVGKQRNYVWILGLLVADDEPGVESALLKSLEQLPCGPLRTAADIGRVDDQDFSGLPGLQEDASSCSFSDRDPGAGSRRRRAARPWRESQPTMG